MQHLKSFISSDLFAVSVIFAIKGSLLVIGICVCLGILGATIEKLLRWIEQNED